MESQEQKRKEASATGTQHQGESTTPNKAKAKNNTPKGTPEKQHLKPKASSPTKPKKGLVTKAEYANTTKQDTLQQQKQQTPKKQATPQKLTPQQPRQNQQTTPKKQNNYGGFRSLSPNPKYGNSPYQNARSPKSPERFNGGKRGSKWQPLNLSKRYLSDITPVITFLQKKLDSKNTSNPSNDTGEEDKPKENGLLHISLLAIQENHFRDGEIVKLVKYLLLNKDRIKIKIMYFFKNLISDEGAEAIAEYIREAPTLPREIHLSHNAITFEGAKKIFDAIKFRNFPIEIPVTTKGKNTKYHTLWIRLEWNVINLDLLFPYLESEGITYCLASNRDQCGPGSCVNTKKSDIPPPAVHLYAINFQYKPIDDSALLLNTKKRAQEIRKQQKARAEAKKLEESETEEETDSETEDEEAEKQPKAVEVSAEEKLEENIELLKESAEATDEAPKPEKAGKKKRTKRKKVETNEEDENDSLPLFLFLDTNAVITMLDINRDIRERSQEGSFAFSKAFTWKNILEKAKKGQFGYNCWDEDGHKVCLMLTNTVMQEVDHQKKKLPHLRAKIVNELQSEEGYLASCVQNTCLEMLGAHQGERLIKERNQEMINLDTLKDPNQYNDVMLINVALFWNQEIGDGGHVILITNDRGCLRMAKEHNLPATSLVDLDKGLVACGDVPWTAPLIKKCIPNAMKTVPGGKSLSTPLRHTSLYDELQLALYSAMHILEAKPEVKFTWKKNLDATTVELSFGPDWDSKIELELAEAEWNISLPLSPGVHQYTFTVDGVDAYDSNFPSLSVEEGKRVNVIHVQGLCSRIVGELEDNVSRWKSLLDQRPKNFIQ